MSATAEYIRPEATVSERIAAELQVVIDNRPAAAAIPPTARGRRGGQPMIVRLSNGERVGADAGAIRTGLAPIVLVGTGLLLGWLRADTDGWIARTDGPVGVGPTARAALRDLGGRFDR